MIHTTNNLGIHKIEAYYRTTDTLQNTLVRIRFHSRQQNCAHRLDRVNCGEFYMEESCG